MKIEGTYGKSLFHNKKNGYSVFTLKLFKTDDKGRDYFVCKGIVCDFAKDIPLILDGEIVTETTPDKEVREFFAVENFEVALSCHESLKSFILACLPPHFREAAAEKICKALEDKGITYENITQYIGRQELEDVINGAKVKGFNKLKTRFVVKLMNEFIAQNSLFDQLSTYGADYHQVIKLRNTFHGRTIKRLAKDPYDCFWEMGLSFKNADMYARDHGMDFCDKVRLERLLELTKHKMESCGNCFLEEVEFLKFFRRVEKVCSAYPAKIPRNLLYLEMNFCPHIRLVNFKNGLYVYSAELSEAEYSVTSDIIRLTRSSRVLLNEMQIREAKDLFGEKLDDVQVTCFDLLSDTAMCFLIGGPGTGKTTTLDAVIKAIEYYCPGAEIALCAPTGRAAQRMKEQTGREACTVHKLLEYHYIEGNQSIPTYNQSNKLSADVIIVDEFSMVGLGLFSKLIAAAKNGAKFIFVGDWNQLQPVEPGSLLHDMVNSGKFNKVELKKSHRQEEKSSIISNAYKMLWGNVTLKEDDSTIIKRFNNNGEARNYLMDVFKEKFDPNNQADLLIVAPQRVGDNGTESLNAEFQRIIHKTDEPHISFGEKVFYENDKVMTIRNNYSDDSRYYNGDIWSVKDTLRTDKISLQSPYGDAIDMSKGDFDDLRLAYACTVHKAQGSEAKTCVVFLPDDVSSSLITRSLLYTAATRAAKTLILISSGDMLEKFIRSTSVARRNSMMTERIINAFEDQIEEKSA